MSDFIKQRGAPVALAVLFALLLCDPSFAQQSVTIAPSASSATLDVTSILNTIIQGVIGIVFAVVGVAVPFIINKYVQDKSAATAVANAVANSLGKIQQAAQSGAVTGIRQIDPHLNVPAYLAPGVQYVLDHAGEEAARFGLTPEAIADKIVAKLGLKNIETNMNITASPMSLVAPPLAPVPEGYVMKVPTVITPEQPSSEGGAPKV